MAKIKIQERSLTLAGRSKVAKAPNCGPFGAFPPGSSPVSLPVELPAYLPAPVETPMSRARGLFAAFPTNPGKGRTLSYGPEPGALLREPGAFSRPPGPSLGPPLSIAQVARLIGCSPWTVRQTLIPRGLPHFRFTASGRLTFYQDQVIRWIENQQKGGKTTK